MPEPQPRPTTLDTGQYPRSQPDPMDEHKAELFLEGQTLYNIACAAARMSNDWDLMARASVRFGMLSSCLVYDKVAGAELAFTELAALAQPHLTEVERDQ